MIKEYRKSNNGITIISLVLTIIILLILSSIIVYSVRNSKNSSAPYNSMIADIVLLEDKILVYYNKYGDIPKRDSASPNNIDGTNYYEIDLSKLENLSLNYGKKNNGDNDIYLVNDQLKVYYKLGVELDGQIYHVNDYKTTNTVHGDSDSEGKTLLELCQSEDYRIGDYIEYHPDEVAAYDPDKGAEVGTYTGYTDKRQVITQEKSLEWRLLYYDNDNVYLVSHKPTNNTIFLKGYKGYNNGINIINEACNTLYSKQGISTVRNITIEDINTHLGGNAYDPNTGMYYGNEVTFTNIYHPESWDAPEWSGTIKTSLYGFSVEDIITDAIHKDLIIGATHTISDYWIASKTQMAIGYTASFGIRKHAMTASSDMITVQSLCSVSSNSNTKNEVSGGASLRPVVCINKNATLADLSK